MMGALLERHPRFAQWLYGFRAPETGTVTLVHRRVYILPVGLGLLFAATVAILLIGSINYSLALGFALTFFLAGLGLVGMVHTARNLAGIGITAGRADPVFAGEPAQFRLYLDSRATFDRPAILVRHRGSGAQFVVDLAAQRATEVVLDVPAHRRGWMPIGRLLLETRFPLGLFRAWSYVEPEARCLVYPKPERRPLPAPTGESASGALRSQSTGNDDFSGLRAYQLADSPRHVAWKAVARTHDMLTKQFTGEAAAELWLDWALLPETLDVERRLSQLAGWVVQAQAAGVLYGLRVPGKEIAPARGDAHAAACLEALAVYETA